MSFDDTEISTQDGQPVGLFEFTLGGLSWRYTSADDDQYFMGFDWIAGAITRTGITQGAGAENDLTITLPADLEIVSMFDGSPPSEIMYLTLREYHEGEIEGAIQWIGTVGNIIKVNPAEASAVCRNLVASFERGGLRLTWGRQCPHALYDVNCRVNKEDHAYPYTVATVAGDSFTVTGYAAPAEGSFAGGFVEWSIGSGTFERRGIESADGGVFKILGLNTGLEVGLGVVLYPGCPRTTAGCIAFDNLPNYGGFPHLPGKSPFDGTPIF